jgi:hypothetical protein
MGGAVAVKVRSMFPGGAVVNDRSFGKLSQVIMEKLSGPMADIGKIIVAVIGLLAAGVLTSTHFVAGTLPAANLLDVLFAFALLGRMGHFCVPRNVFTKVKVLNVTEKATSAAVIGTLVLKILRQAYCTWYGLALYQASTVGSALTVIQFSVLGCCAGLISFVPGWGQRLMEGRGGMSGRSALVYLVCLLGWEFDVVEDWVKYDGAKLLIYNQRDGMITYPNSLYVAATNAADIDTGASPCGNQKAVCLRQYESPHMNWLNSDMQDWSNVLEQYQILLAGT